MDSGPSLWSLWYMYLVYFMTTEIRTPHNILCPKDTISYIMCTHTMPTPVLSSPEREIKFEPLQCYPLIRTHCIKDSLGSQVFPLCVIVHVLIVQGRETFEIDLKTRTILHNYVQWGRPGNRNYIKDTLVSRKATCSYPAPNAMFVYMISCQIRTPC